MTDILPEKNDSILERVRKPSSYLGTEPGACRKDHANVEASIALIFPDLYEIGMSHLGLKILYDIINQRDDMVAERAFAPAHDFAEIITAEQAPLMSLESKTPLASFDVLGFTIPYELSYTTILWILDLAGIPLRSADRDDTHPIIIGGGAGVFNPEPVAEFFDGFVLGDGEAVTVEIMETIIATKDLNREERLLRLARIPGVYVPAFFDVGYKESGEVSEIAPRFDWYNKADRVYLPTLAESPFPEYFPVPFGQTAHDRLNVELDRGCAQGCRFCQAGTTYRPIRERKPEEVTAIFDDALKRTGYGEISLTSLSAGDYTKIEPLLEGLMARYSDKRVSVSLPSLRPATVTSNMIDQIKKVRKSGFTIAAEAGSDRLRKVINKKVTDEEIITAATRLLEAGWRSLKLYFMIGLPTETMEDVDAIFHLANEISRLKVNGSTFSNVTVSVSNFVPKSHTAFQWSGQDSVESLRTKKERLFELIKPKKKLKLKWHDFGMSQMEAVFSRGDRKLVDVIEAAYRTGAKLDAWTEHFDHDRWLHAFEAKGIDPRFYAEREIGRDEVLPWDMIDTGLTKEYFMREMKLAERGEVTQDCKFDRCLLCGLDPKTCFKPYDMEPAAIPEPKAAAETGRYKYRVRFRKVGTSRFFSHLELRSLIVRAFRVVDLPIAYSQGFSPHPKIAFGPALPVGMESEDEYIDVECVTEVDWDAITSGVNNYLPEGIDFVNAKPLEPGVKSISASIVANDIEIELVEPADTAEVRSAVDDFMRLDSYKITRKEKEIDLRPLVEGIEIDQSGTKLTYTATVGGKGSVRPEDIILIVFGKRDHPVKSVTKMRAVMQNEARSLQ